MINNSIKTIVQINDDIVLEYKDHIVYSEEIKDGKCFPNGLSSESDLDLLIEKVGIVLDYLEFVKKTDCIIEALREHENKGLSFMI